MVWCFSTEKWNTDCVLLKCVHNLVYNLIKAFRNSKHLQDYSSLNNSILVQMYQKTGEAEAQDVSYCGKSHQDFK